MNDMGLWKLLVDVGMLLSCCYFLYSLTRSGRPSASTRHLMELNAKLQSAIREADQTGKTLNEQLLRRQEQLEKLLFDVETMEHRLNRVLTSSDEKKGSLEVELGKAKHFLTQLITQSDQAENLHSEVSKDRDMLRAFLDLSKPVETFAGAAAPAAPQPQTFEAAPATEEIIEESEEEEIPAWSELNIFGAKLGEEFKEDVVAAPSTSEDDYVPLSRTIEKKVEESEIQSAEIEQINDIYTAAENMLKAGRSLELVAAETSLPVEEVKLLKRLLDQDRAMREEQEKKSTLDPVPSDERLGVLGMIKRHVPFF